MITDLLVPRLSYLAAATLVALLTANGAFAQEGLAGQPQPVYPDQVRSSANAEDALPETDESTKESDALTEKPGDEPQGQTTHYGSDEDANTVSASKDADIESLSKDPAQWPTAAKNYASTRYSELDQINAKNVNKLQAAWMFSLGTVAGRKRPRSSSTMSCT